MTILLIVKLDYFSEIDLYRFYSTFISTDLFHVRNSKSINLLTKRSSPHIYNRKPVDHDPDSSSSFCSFSVRRICCCKSWRFCIFRKRCLSTSWIPRRESNVFILDRVGYFYLCWEKMDDLPLLRPRGVSS